MTNRVNYHPQLRISGSLIGVVVRDFNEAKRRVVTLLNRGDLQREEILRNLDTPPDISRRALDDARERGLIERDGEFFVLADEPDSECLDAE